MSLPHETQVEFWHKMADRLGNGQTLAKALKDSSRLSPRLQSLAIAIDLGKTFSEAMAVQGDLFTPAMVSMMRCGELGGVMDLAARQVFEALDDGSLLWAPDGKTDAAVTGAMLCLFGHLLASGVPIAQAAELAGAEIDWRGTGGLAHDIKQAILERRSVGPVFGRSVPSLAEPLQKAEAAGDLDTMAIELGRRLMNTKTESTMPADAPEARDAVNKLLLSALADRASDIHLEPDGVRIRIDGVLQTAAIPPGVTTRAMIERFMVMAYMDLEKRQFPQDGRIVADISGKALDLRVSTIPTVDGDRMVVRLLIREAMCFSLAQVVNDPAKLALIHPLLSRPNGVIICSGPTGSGKTTLMYSMLMELDRQKLSVMSVEDPVEVRLPGVSQVQVNMAAGLTYPRAIRSFLRQDPDVIMLGEIRDIECAQLCCQAAMTGHLMISTMHTDSAPTAIQRLVDVGIEPFIVGSSLVGVIAQRLVRRLCPHCRKPAEVAVANLPAEVRSVLGETSPTFYAPGGCDQCNHTGYRGRLAIHEILVVTDALRDAILRGANSSELSQIARAAGMRTMRQDAALLAAQGQTSLDEVFRVAPPCA